MDVNKQNKRSGKLIGLALPTSHSHDAIDTSIDRQQSTVITQVPCSSDNSFPVSASPSHFSVDITPDISNNTSNSPSTDLFASFNDDLSNDPHSSQNTDSNLLPPASTYCAPTPPVAAASTTSQHPNDDELAASLQAPVDITNRHRWFSSIMGSFVARWMDRFDIRYHPLIIERLYQAMNSIEMEIEQLKNDMEIRN
ncbi:uncharacterized protein LOC131211070 [Anopheles bellator]|uniref:uncharacterized protein LOC131211070 n=1 Tax=Anopheles bellator TaxID=139047 RepID=UPI0026471C82|nr:uncharacterized protein LOC131211070 [Anopheles bellator]